MTAPALRTRTRPGLRVVAGRASKPRLSGWLFFSLVAVLAFLGMVFVRTSLDRSTIDLASLERNLAEARSLNQRLRLEIARLEARVAAVVPTLGMVYPQTSQRLIVEGVHQQTLSDPRWSDLNRFAAGQLAVTDQENQP